MSHDDLIRKLDLLLKRLLLIGLLFGLLLGLFIAFFLSTFPRWDAQPRLVTFTSPDGITLSIHDQWYLFNYDLLWVMIENDSDAPFDTTGFSFNGHPLPDAPTSLWPWITDLPQLPATIPPYSTANGVLRLPHPANSDEPWPLLIHYQGPLLITVPHE